MRRLIINADDFGLAPSVNEAIISCLEAGRLSSTTLIVNAPSAAEALTYARSHPAAAVGLHLNIVHFLPLTDCPGLAGPAGFFGLPALVRQQLFAPRQLYLQVKAELEAQLDCFQSAAGRLPTHVDTHLWSQVLPAAFQAIVDVASARGIRAVRNIEGFRPVASLRAALQIGGWAPDNVKRSAYQAAKSGWFLAQSRLSGYPGRLRARGLFTPEHYFGVSEGLLYRDVATRLRLIEWSLRQLPSDSISEFMVHPGGEAAPEGVIYSAVDAVIETQALLSDRLPEVLARSGACLMPGYGPGEKESG